MNAIVGLSIGLLNGILGIFNKEKALKMYILLSIVSPVVYIFGTRISYEIMFFFPMFILFLTKKKRKTLLKKESKYIIVYFIVFIIATLIMNFMNQGRTALIVLLGNVRMVVLFIILTNSSNLKDYYKKILAIVLYINVFVMLIQLTVPNAVEIFYNLYAKDSATAMLSSLELGRFTRLFGTFNNIAPAGFFFLVVLSIYLEEYTKKNSLKNIIILVISILCGMATSSRLFIVGMPIILIVNFVLEILVRNKIQVGKRKKIDIKKPILIMLIIVSVIMFLKYTEGILSTFHYINNLSFTNMFSGRYSSESGNLIDTMNVFKDNWLIGVGATRPVGEFVGDSLYVQILHDTGIIGIFIIGTFLLRLITNNIRQFNRQNLLLILCIIMGGFAFATIFNFIGILNLSYISVNTKVIRKIQNEDLRGKVISNRGKYTRNAIYNEDTLINGRGYCKCKRGET